MSQETPRTKYEKMAHRQIIRSTEESRLINNLILCMSIPISSKGKDHGMERALNLINKASPELKVGQEEIESTKRFLNFDSPITEEDAQELLQTAQRIRKGPLATPHRVMKAHEVLCSMGEEYRQKHNIVRLLQMGMGIFLWACTLECPDHKDDTENFSKVVLNAIAIVKELRNERLPDFLTLLPEREVSELIPDQGNPWASYLRFLNTAQEFPNHLLDRLAKNRAEVLTSSDEIVGSWRTPLDVYERAAYAVDVHEMNAICDELSARAKHICLDADLNITHLVTAYRDLCDEMYHLVKREMEKQQLQSGQSGEGSSEA